MNKHIVPDQTPTFAKHRWHKAGFAIWLALVGATVYGSLTHANIGTTVTAHDKYTHGIVYAIVMFWFVQITSNRTAHWLCAGFLLILGGFLELIQNFDPIRHGELADLLFNSIGIAIALGLSYTPLGRLSYLWQRRCSLPPAATKIYDTTAPPANRQPRQPR